MNKELLNIPSDEIQTSSAQTKLGAASIIPAVVNGLFSLGSQAYNQINYENNRDYNNLYNSPKQQMLRMQQAGINPNMALGSISSGQSNSQPPQVNNPFERVINDVANIQQLRNNLLQNEYLKEQINGLRIQNKFNSDTYGNRYLTLAYRTWSAYYQQELAQGRITYQTFLNRMAEMNKNYQEWINQPLGTVDLDFYTIDENGARLPAKRSFTFNYSPQQSTYLSNLIKQHIGDLSQLQGYDFNEIFNPLRLQQSSIYNQRGDIALNFERMWNMPFGHSNVWSGLATALIYILADKYPQIKTYLPTLFGNK